MVDFWIKIKLPEFNSEILEVIFGKRPEEEGMGPNRDCDECWGTGYLKGYGAPCSRGCRPAGDSKWGLDAGTQSRDAGTANGDSKSGLDGGPTLQDCRDRFDNVGPNFDGPGPFHTIVYAPDLADSEGDTMSADKIKKMAHDFLANGGIVSPTKTCDKSFGDCNRHLGAEAIKHFGGGVYVNGVPHCLYTFGQHPCPAKP